MNTKEQADVKKCTLRQVSQGIVATIDKRPKAGDYAYEPKHNIYYKWVMSYTPVTNKYHKIIASAFGVGKELYVEYFGWAGLDRMEFNIFIKVWEREENKYIDFTKPYEYTETDNQVIIKL